MFLRLSAFPPYLKKHLTADESQQHKGQPVIDGLDFVGKGAGDGVADERHESLEEAKAAGHFEDGGCPDMADHHTAGDAHGKGIHGETRREQEQRDYIHENDASFRAGVEGILCSRKNIISQACVLVNAAGVKPNC